MYSLLEECKANIRAFDAMPDIISEVKYWLPFIEEHFEGKSDEHDARIDALKAALKKGGF